MAIRNYLVFRHYVSKITYSSEHKPNFPLTSAQKPAFCIPSSPSILFMTIQNHALDVSRAIVMVEKEWFG
jgi:hypothetical protein